MPRYIAVRLGMLALFQVFNGIMSIYVEEW